MKKKLFKYAVVVLSFALFGCAASVVVEPTYEERMAVKPFKKTVAIIEIEDAGSPVAGIESVVFSKLENGLAGHFNLVERQKIESVKKERDFRHSADVEELTQLGKLLGADYVIYGNTRGSFTQPRLQHNTSNYDGKFTGRIWEEVCGQSEVGVKMVDVSSGMILYANKMRGNQCEEKDNQGFQEEQSYYDALKQRSQMQQIVKVASSFFDLKKEYSLVVSNAIDQAASGINKDIRLKFAQSGEVLQILSQKEVLINLGSAFGIRPGDKLIIWEEKPAITDPRTGVLVTPKEKKAVLTVSKVNSGLSCVAKGSKKQIYQIRVGDKVYTY